MMVVNDVVPDWRQRSIHESSPLNRGASIIFARDCIHYLATQFFPGVEPGQIHDGVRCEDLEQQTFNDNRFDVVITQDVMEHVFHPDRAHREIVRTLRPGGVHIHTTPIYKDQVRTRVCARRRPDASIEHLEPPEYHGNPVDDAGSLVTIKYGYDVVDLLAEWAEVDVEIRRFRDLTHGIVADFSEVIICRKR